MRDDNGMSSYFIAIKFGSNFGSGFKVKQSRLSQYWNWISGDKEKKLKVDI